MNKVKFKINDEIREFDAALEYSMVGVKNGLPFKLFQSYEEVEKYGNRNEISFDLVACENLGSSLYPETTKVEPWNPDKSSFTFVKPVVECKPEEPKVELNTKSKKLRKKKN